MREIVLDCVEWRARDDLYDAFFSAVAAPSWHGRNFDALTDSICVGSINQIEVPYCLVLQNTAQLSPPIGPFVDDFIAFIRELKATGCAVDIRLE